MAFWHDQPLESSTLHLPWGLQTVCLAPCVVAAWSEFNAKKLRVIYKGVVMAPWKDAHAEVKLSEFETIFGDEDGFDHGHHRILRRAIVPAVNCALMQTQMSCEQWPALHLGRRGRCQYGDDNRI
jgi:hypothetical protein